MSRAVVRRRVEACLIRGGDFAAAYDDVLAGGAMAPSTGWIAAQRKRVERASIAVIARGDADFPESLQAIPDAPIALFVRGSLAALAPPGVAIVGSRRCSVHAERFARKLARDVACSGNAVVSGLAIGIDGAAHRGALDGSAVTVAVLGSGHAHIYPRRHDRLADEISERGAIVSEHPPLTLPHQRHFPERNRLISGLSRAVVVIEAGERSGSLTTARMALEQGREVMAVPGAPFDGRSRGCHRLIQSGAALVDDVADVFSNLGIPMPALAKREEAALDAWTARILAAVTVEDPIGFDDLIERLRLPVERLLEALARLEVDGFVERLDGGYIRRPL